jgi:hypothetical protein
MEKKINEDDQAGRVISQGMPLTFTEPERKKTAEYRIY